MFADMLNIHCTLYLVPVFEEKDLAVESTLGSVFRDYLPRQLIVWNDNVLRNWNLVWLKVGGRFNQRRNNRVLTTFYGIMTELLSDYISQAFYNMSDTIVCI